ncbi:MAG: GatB/YqeY domain-containing protein [Bacteroidetes bacterium]|nr:GatB/YqeY domain-containing protein [Bacteroidota bacterium]MBK8658182.1 GatB/YqeY domain-containing protein [Bacteroidota bacterium]
MTLEEKINTDLKAAMMARDEATLRGLRAIKSGIILAKTEKGANGVVSPEKEVQILQKMVKQRKDSIAEFEKANRQDLIQKEQEEVSVIEKYLPAMMGEDEIREVVKQVIASTGATTQKEMGKVMGMVSKQLAGKADNKVISEIIKSLLTA